MFYQDYTFITTGELPLWIPHIVSSCPFLFPVDTFPQRLTVSAHYYGFLLSSIPNLLDREVLISLLNCP